VHLGESDSTDRAMDVVEVAREVAPHLSEVRRHLHAHPEPSEAEYETTEYLRGIVSKLGLPVHLGNDRRGLWADIGSGTTSDPRIALRGDVDALPIQTELRTPYASQVAGIMHACGHDAHATMVYGAGVILTRLAEQGRLPDSTNVRLLFQPAEETSTGATHMIASGGLDSVDAAIALHVDPSRSVGTLAGRDGAFTAGCELLDCTIRGEPGHGARPHLTGDTIHAASTWIDQVYRCLPRSHDPFDPVVINIGRIQGGLAPNVVPDSIEMEGTLRTLSVETSEAAKALIERVGLGLQLSHRVRVVLNFGLYTPPVVNDPSVHALMRSAAARIVGDAQVHWIEAPSMGAEDFAFIADRIPSTMMRLGVAGPKLGIKPLHTPLFDIDETSLVHGAAVLALTAIGWCHRQRQPSKRSGSHSSGTN